MVDRYFLFLLINVIFIFLLASTYWQVVRDFYERPGKIPEKLADALHQGTARNYFVCYVILQGAFHDLLGRPDLEVAIRSRHHPAPAVESRRSDSQPPLPSVCHSDSARYDPTQSQYSITRQLTFAMQTSPNSTLRR